MIGQPKATSSTEAQRRLLTAAALSLLAHAILLALHFGGITPGVPTFGARLAVRLATTPLPTPPSPAPETARSAGTLASVPSVSSDTADVMDGAQAGQVQQRVSAPNAGEPHAPRLRVIAQDAVDQADFAMPLPVPVEAIERTLDVGAVQEGADEVRDEASLAADGKPAVRHALAPRAAIDDPASAATTLTVPEVRRQELAEQGLAELERVASQRVLQQQEEQARERERLAMEEAQQRERERLAMEEAQQRERERLAMEEAQRRERDRLAMEEAQQRERERLALEETQQRERERLAMEEAQQRERERLAMEEAQRRERERLAKELAQQRERDRLAVGRSRALADAGQPASSGPGAAPAAGEGPAGGIVLPRSMLASDAGLRAREAVRGLGVLDAPPRALVEREAARRRAVVTRSEKDVPLRMYVEGWRQKIERNASIFAADGRSGRVEMVVVVSIRSDGSVEDVLVVRTSGRAALDAAVRNIVRVNARYAAFPVAISDRYDVIEIRRVWVFDGRLQLVEELD